MNLTAAQQQQLAECAAILEANSARLRLLIQARYTEGVGAAGQIAMASNDVFKVADRLDEILNEVA